MEVRDSPRQSFRIRTQIQMRGLFGASVAKIRSPRLKRRRASGLENNAGVVNATRMRFRGLSGGTGRGWTALRPRLLRGIDYVAPALVSIYAASACCCYMCGARSVIVKCRDCLMHAASIEDCGVPYVELTSLDDAVILYTLWSKGGALPPVMMKSSGPCLTSLCHQQTVRNVVDSQVGPLCNIIAATCGQRDPKPSRLSGCSLLCFRALEAFVVDTSLLVYFRVVGTGGSFCKRGALRFSNHRGLIFDRCDCLLRRFRGETFASGRSLKHCGMNVFLWSER